VAAEVILPPLAPNPNPKIPNAFAWWSDVAAVTVDSPEKHRGGMIGHCHGAADQDDME
jgi:hypothetical protein